MLCVCNASPLPSSPTICLPPTLTKRATTPNINEVNPRYWSGEAVGKAFWAKWPSSWATKRSQGLRAWVFILVQRYSRGHICSITKVLSVYALAWIILGLLNSITWWAGSIIDAPPLTSYT